MKTYNITGKNNDMVITISAEDESSAVMESRRILQLGAFRIEEVDK